LIPHSLAQVIKLLTHSLNWPNIPTLIWNKQQQKIASSSAVSTPNALHIIRSKEKTTIKKSNAFYINSKILLCKGTLLVNKENARLQFNQTINHLSRDKENASSNGKTSNSLWIGTLQHLLCHLLRRRKKNLPILTSKTSTSWMTRTFASKLAIRTLLVWVSILKNKIKINICVGWFHLKDQKWHGLFKLVMKVTATGHSTDLTSCTISCWKRNLPAHVHSSIHLMDFHALIVHQDSLRQLETQSV